MSQEDKVNLGIDFILSHLKSKTAPTFPLAVTTYRWGKKQIIVDDEIEMLEVYKQSIYIDCTVSNFNSLCDPEKSAIRQDASADDEYCCSKQNNYNSRMVSDIVVIINLHRANFETLAGHIRALYSLLQNMREYLQGSHPTILWTGNSFSIYQPIRAIFLLQQYPKIFIGPKSNSSYLVMSSLSPVCNSLVDFIAKRIANYNSIHIPISIKPALNIPGTFNSECIITRNAVDPEVQIVQEWNGTRPRIDLMLMIEFYSYLKDHLFNLKKEQEQLQEEQRQEDNGNTSYYHHYDRSHYYQELAKHVTYKGTEQRYFLLCTSCFWCASSYHNHDSTHFMSSKMSFMS